MSISSGKLAWVCRSMSTMLDAGLTVLRSLEVLEDKAGERGLKPVFADIRRRISDGATIREAFEKSGRFPGFLLDMIAVGEKSGTLDIVLEEAGTFYEMKNRLWRTFVSSIIFPVLQYVAAVALITLIMYILNSVRGEPTAAGYHLLLGYGIPVLIYAAYRFFASYGVSARWFQELLLRVPILGELSSRLALARFSVAMHAMLEAGTSAPRALRYSFHATDNEAFTARAESAEKVVTSGEPFSIALRQTGLFPEDYLSIVSVGEETGQLSEKMDWLADHYGDKAEQALQTATTFAARAIWVGVAIIMILFIFQIASQYAAAIQQNMPSNLR